MMVNRSRSETWTCGIKNEQVKQKLQSCSSESTLELYSRGTKYNDNSHYDCVKYSKNVTYDDSISLDNERTLFEQRRPVFSSSSMESVDLTEPKDSLGDTDSVSSISFEHITFSQYSSVESNDLPDIPKLETTTENTATAKEQEKSSINSFFSWISSPRSHLKKQTAIKITASDQGNCSQSLNQDLKFETSERSTSRRRSSVSLDRGISGLKSLKESIKSSLSSINSPGIRRNHSFEPLSTTALILEDRPRNLPSKSTKEIEKHQLQYNKMLENAKKQEKKNSLKREKLLKEQQKHEKAIANTGLIWANEIIPNWKSTYQTSRVRNLWWEGLPSSVRGTVWKLAIGNDLNITKDLYEIMVTRAHEKLRMFNEGHIMADDTVSADRESTMDLIRLDISRTFPHLCIFQKGAPYYDLLHDILGAYVCYRPDVGYVQGMSFMAATLLLNMETSDAFIAFANIMNKPCQVAFYNLDETQISTYFATYNVFFEDNLPKLYAHFKQIRLTPDMYLIDWVFAIFSKALNLDVASRIWDVFCRDGEEFVFRTAIAILKLHADVLIHSDFIHSAQLLTKLPSTITQQLLFSSIHDVNMVVRGNRRWKNVLASIKGVK